MNLKRTLITVLLMLLCFQLIGVESTQAQSLIIIPASPDYANDARGYAWDFSDTSRYALELTSRTFKDGGTLTNGWFNGVTTTTDPKVWLLDPNIPGTNITQNEGAYLPIDTSSYRYLTFRICVDVDSVPTFVYWHKNSDTTQANSGGAGFKYVGKGCQVVNYDLVADHTAGGGDLLWTAGPIQAIAIRIGSLTGINVKLDSVRLSNLPPSSGPVLPINWQPTSNTINLYFADDTSGSNLTPIAHNLQGSTGYYNWIVPPLDPRQYFVFTSIGGTLSPLGSFRVNEPPSGKILDPSFTSGPDFASQIVNNPWDMDSSRDIALVNNITNVSYANGIMSGVTTNNDPRITLNLGGYQIDPTKFYYLTYRFRDAGTRNIGKGSVARIFWWNSPDTSTAITTTKDIVVYDGWRTVTIDLRTALLGAGGIVWQNGGLKYRLRFDPLEFLDPRTFYLDDIKLTGNGQAATTFTIKFVAHDLDQLEFSTRFLYSTKPNGANPVAISCGVQSKATGPYKVYIPLVIQSGSEGKCIWHTAIIPNGTYWIVMQLDDGYNLATKVSEAPVEIRN